MRRALVVGYGSIGARHARLLTEEGCDVAVVSRREVAVERRFATLGEALEAHLPDYVVVANRTSEHAATLATLAARAFRGAVLVEKPLFGDLQPVPANAFEHLGVAYNLRFHPGIQALREALRGERILTVQAYAGQYLPSWRPGRDYREVYSARRSGGGGVLRDLSHEIDYLNWLLGGWRRLTALGGHLSSLEIETEDVVVLAIEYGTCAATLHLNYLDRVGRRSILVNTDDHTIELDMTAGVLRIDGSETPVSSERDDTYRLQHRAMLSGRVEDVCTADEALEVMHMVAATERAMETQKWIRR